MKIHNLFALLAIFGVAAHGQKAVLLHKANGTQQAFYSNSPLSDAYTAAGNGDTIYVPGGIFAALSIDKQLKLYGTGHYPDSTAATGTTIIDGVLNVTDNGDSTQIEGFIINGGTNISAGASYVRLKRNRLNSTLAILGNNGHYEGNVLTHISTGGPLNLLFVNNIVQNTIGGAGNGTVFRNNIFLQEYQVLQYPANSYVLFENNIFLTTADWNYNGYSVNNTFTKNIFYSTPAWGSNTQSGNYVGVASVFVSQSGYTFNYAHNYHLQNPGLYTGVDGTQCGIYGGSFIYKEGAVPSNPHIIEKIIAGATDSQGKLNVNIKVAAQNN